MNLIRSFKTFWIYSPAFFFLVQINPVLSQYKEVAQNGNDAQLYNEMAKTATDDMNLFLQYSMQDVIFFQNYCFCFVDKFSKDHLEVTVKEPGNNEKFIACKNFMRQHSEDVANPSRGRTFINREITKKDRKLESKLCSAEDIREKFKEYRNAQDLATDELEKQVEEFICTPPQEILTDMIISRCRKKLKNIVEELDEDIFSKCDAEFTNNGRRRVVNKCVERNIYTLILNNQNNQFFRDFCPESDKENAACREKLRDKLKMTYYQQELAYCHDKNNFHEAQLKGKIVCEDLLISKLLTSATHLETKALVDCLNDAELTSPESVKKCIAEFRNPSDPEEQDLLKQIRDKYCSNRVYIYKKDQDSCMENFLTNNLSDLEIYPECNARVVDIKNVEDKTIALQRCQRMQQYTELLNDRTLEVSDCWKTDKYKTMAERRSCRDKAYEFNGKIADCEIKSSSDLILKCLAELNRDEDAAFLTQYLDTKAYKLKIDVSQCPATANQNNCLLNLMGKNSDKFAGTDKNSCYQSDSFGECDAQMKSEKLNSEPDERILPNNLNNNVNNISNRDSNQPDASGQQNVRGVDLEARIGNEEAKNDTTSIGELDLVDDMSSFAIDANNIMTVNTEDYACDCLYKSSLIGVGSKVFAKSVQSLKDSSLLEDYKNSTDMQGEASATLLGAVDNAMLANNIYELGEIAKKNKAESGRDYEMDKMAAGNPPTNCSKDVGNNTVFNIYKHDYDEFNTYTQNVINQVPSAKTQTELDLIINEYRAYVSGASHFKPRVDANNWNFLKEEEFTQHPEYTKLITGFGLKFYYAMTLNIAYGADESNKEFGMDNILKMATTVVPFLNLSKKNKSKVENADALSRLTANSDAADSGLEAVDQNKDALANRKIAIETLKQSQ